MQAATGAAAIDLAGLLACDTAGATLLLTAQRQTGASLINAAKEVGSLLARIEKALPREAPARSGGLARAANPVRATADFLAFMGEVAVACLRAPARARMFPRRDLLALSDAAGLRAIPLVLLLGFLMGLILAFQSSIPLRQFGAEIFVVNLVVISLLRELGPLLTSVVLAGRTSSAFAAELGTMVVNDEVAALRTMGVDPVTMLVLPRLAAAVLVMPALTLLLELAGMAGMCAVMGVLGFPLIAVGHQITQSARLADLLGGLFKALAFGAAVATIGCRQGLAAGIGPRAVGEAATQAVVGSILATILIDGVFTILYFRLGL
jgi:phospholipid/cholesterol/gamma-HCH transport system permease protein